MNDYKNTIQEVVVKFCAEIVEKQDELIQKTIREIGGVQYHHITIDRAKTLEALQLYQEQFPKMQSNILKSTIEAYGQMSQVDMAIEEMSELTKALCKERRTQFMPDKHTKAIDNIIEEIADVSIMLSQLILMFDSNGAVQHQVDCKVTRLAERLTEHEIRNATQPHRWISVTEKLPEENGKYLVCTERGHVYQTKFYNYPESTGGHWGQKDKGRSITHWMPLPERVRQEATVYDKTAPTQQKERT